MDVDDTRDIAVDTAAQVKAHVVDCLEVRRRNEAKLDKIDNKLDKMMWIVLPALGGLVLASHAVDWYMTLAGHK